MKTEKTVIGTDITLKNMFELCLASKDKTTKYIYLIKSAQMVMNEKKQISCSMLHKMLELMLEYMPDDSMTTEIRYLYNYGHASM